MVKTLRRPRKGANRSAWRRYNSEEETVTGASSLGVPGEIVMVKEITVKTLGPGSSPRRFFNRTESTTEVSSRMLVKEYTVKALPEGRLHSLFRDSYLNYYAKTAP